MKCFVFLPLLLLAASATAQVPDFNKAKPHTDIPADRKVKSGLQYSISVGEMIDGQLFAPKPLVDAREVYLTELMELDGKFYLTCPRSLLAKSVLVAPPLLADRYWYRLEAGNTTMILEAWIAGGAFNLMVVR